MRLILGQSVKLSAIGTGVGLAAALGLTWLLGRLLFGVKSTDPLAYAMVILTLAAVAFIAAFVPARRATQVAPMMALRHERAELHLFATGFPAFLPARAMY